MAPHPHFVAKNPLSDRLHSAIARSPYLAGRNVRVEQHDNRIVLKGVVSSYFQKQLAQESIRNIEGVTQIHNEIEVISL